MKGRQIVFEAAGQASVRTFEVPSPGAGELLLANDYTVISPGTELANFKNLPNTGTRENGFPFFPGYSGSGRVAALGDGVTGFTVGDRVVVNWGGHRSHTVKRAESVLRIEDASIDLLDAAFAPIAAFSFLGVRKLKLELGESAMIAGLGILGIFALQVALLSGAIPVIASDFDPARRALALKLGATRAFSPEEGDFVERVKASTGGRGPDTVVEATGSAAALQQALDYVAWEGRVSLLGCTRVSDAPIDFYRTIHRRGVTLVGAHTFTRAKMESAPGRWTEQDDYRTFLKLLAAKRIQVRPLASEIVSPEEAPTA